MYTKYETVIPDDENPCVQKVYYMRDTIFPFPLEYILNDVDQSNVKIEPEKAMDAYFILQARYRRHELNRCPVEQDARHNKVDHGKCKNSIFYSSIFSTDCE